MIQHLPDFSAIRFDGFTSRCRTFALCAASRASATSASVVATDRKYSSVNRGRLTLSFDSEAGALLEVAAAGSLCEADTLCTRCARLGVLLDPATPLLDRSHFTTCPSVAPS